MKLSIAVAVFIILLHVLSLSVAQDNVSSQEAAKRLLRASLSAPNADVDMILQDAQHLFGDFLPDSLDEFTIETTTGNEPSCATTSTRSSSEAKQRKEEIYYADRHAKRIASIKDDFDCMEREFDASSPDFDPNEAAAVLRKCRLLVIRNMFSQEVIQSYKTAQANFLSDLHLGKIDRIGKTTLGENGYHVKRDNKRYDIVMPHFLLNEDIVADKKSMEILSNRKVFGSVDDFVAQSIGTVIAESGAKDSQYHTDEIFLFGEYAYDGVASGDLPPYAVTMFIPLLNVTADHGPTEFCMGTNYYHGLSYESEFWDQSLHDEGTPFWQLEEFENGNSKAECPKEFSRSPLGNLGDAIFFDYTITHRGTRNISPDRRAMSYVVYARPWFRDASNFADDVLEHTKKNARKYSEFEKLTQNTRFALIEPSEEDYERMPLESINNFLYPDE